MSQIYRLILAFLLIVSVFTASAQTLLIDYNYQQPAASRWATLVGADTVYRPDRNIPMRRVQDVRVVVRNVNMEALRPELVIRQGLSLDSSLRTTMSSLLTTVASLAAPAGVDLKSMMGMKSRGAAPTQLLYAPMQVDLDDVRGFETASVVDLDGLIRNRLNEVHKWQQVREQLRQIRYDPTLPKQEAQRRCQQAAQQLTASAQTLLADEAQARQAVERIAVENAEYLKFALATLQHRTVSATASVTTTARGDQAAPVFTDFVIAEAVRLHQKAIPEDLASQLSQVLGDVVTHYQAVQRNPYATVFQAKADKNTESVLLQFYESTPAGAARRLVRSEPFSLAQPNQLQIVTSFGLSFIAYSQRLQSYGVVNGKVAASELDWLTPALSGFFHMISRSETARVRLGGHLGVGVPLTEAKGVCFMIGPSLAVGRRSNVLVNAGAFTGRVTRLGAGLQVGDAYSGTLPTATRYEWGFHVGVSYQLNLKR
ncbi:hypothetical protein ACAW74_12905 [Fibrella sp. WM1]|uniref:hypothetical protein n=1 Tax=Fibrella musci TaxID=3242485 RepID=UPI00351FBD13